MTRRRISVTGLGYVGLPLVVALASRGYQVLGFDADPERVRELCAGTDRTGSVTPALLSEFKDIYTSHAGRLAEADFHIIAVPTPVNRACEPDLSALYAATAAVGACLKPKALVVYESTVYPGLTEEECIPRLEQASGLTCGVDFAVGYSPERVNPGDATHSLENTAKIIACADADALAEMATVYGELVSAGLHRASSIRVAEAAKVIENTQRDLNIALMNELAILFGQLGIDTADVLEAAGSKWNFMRFTPGLVGGHCIGVDPYYLTYKARSIGYEPRLVLAGRALNDGMGVHIARCVIRELLRTNAEKSVTVLGLSFKPDVPDVRNSRVADLVAELCDFGIDVQVCDPVADAVAARRDYDISMLPLERLKPAGAVVLAVPHRCFIDGGWALVQGLLSANAGVVYDVKSVLSRACVPDRVHLLRL